MMTRARARLPARVAAAALACSLLASAWPLEAWSAAAPRPVSARAGQAPAPTRAVALPRLPLPQGFLKELSAGLLEIRGLDAPAALQRLSIRIEDPATAAPKRLAARALAGVILRPESLLAPLQTEILREHPGVEGASAARALEQASTALSAEERSGGALASDAIPASLSELFEGPNSPALRNVLAFYRDPARASATQGGGAQAPRLRLREAPAAKTPEAAEPPAPASTPSPTPAPSPATPAASEAAPVASPAAPAEPAKASGAPAGSAKTGNFLPAGAKAEVRFPSRLKDWLSPGRWLLGALAFGHLLALRRFTRETIRNLAVIDGDSGRFDVRVLPSVSPNASISPGLSRMNIYLGLLGFTADADEFASVLAHEMTHDNPEHLKPREDEAAVESLLGSTEGYSDLKPDQREEIRADLGSVDRLIAAGYNPWAAYRLERKFAQLNRRLFSQRLFKFLMRKFAKRSLEFLEEHSISEVRMGAIKAYIVSRGYREDLSELTRSRRPLPLSMLLLRWRMAILGFVFLTPVLHLLYFSGLLWEAVLWVARLFGGSAYETLSGAGKGFSDHILKPIGGFFSGVASWVWEHALEPVFSLIVDALGWIWSGIGFIYQHSLAYMLDAPALWIPVLLAPALLQLLRLRRRSAFLRNAGKAAVSDYTLVRSHYKVLSRRADAPMEGKALARALRRAGQALLHLDRLYRDSYAYGNKRSLGLTQLKKRWLALYRDLLLRAMEEREETLREGLEPLLEIPPALASNPPALALEDPELFPVLERAVARLTPEWGEKESKLARLLRLRREALGFGPETPVSDVLRVARALQGGGLVDTAAAIFDSNWRRCLAFVLSKENKDAELGETFILIERGLRSKSRSYGRTSGRSRRERRVIAYSLSLRSTAERLALRAFFRDSPDLGFLASCFHGLEGMLLRLRLARSFHSVSTFAAFLETELRARHVRPEELAEDFHRLILSRPAWLRSKEDLEALIAEPAFWPKLTYGAPGELEAQLRSIIEKQARRFPQTWSYEPGASELLHALYLKRLKALGLAPSDLEGRIRLWETLTRRGVTSYTDELFAQLYALANASQRARLEDAAAAGRIWDQSSRAEIIQRRLRASEDYRTLLDEKDPAERERLLRTLVERLQRDCPERGIHYARILEELSRDIRSSREESVLIHAAKTPRSGEKSEDLGLRVLSDITEKALGWRKARQWELVLFLRGDIPPTRRIKKAFPSVGPERVRRMFQLLPLSARVALLDPFLDSPRGLLAKLNPRRGWARRIIVHVMPRGDAGSREIAEQILEAFLHALKATKNKPLQSYVLAYLLSLPKDAGRTPGSILKDVLEIFGAMGVKIGQFLAASQLLPEAETRLLRGLQERAQIPAREDIYRDLEEIGGKGELPFEMGDLLGAASMKYAFLAREKKSGGHLVPKVFRLSALAHTPTEFDQLEAMALHLKKHHGAKYGVFRAILKAARKAVEREMSPEHEMRSSALARRELYAGRGDDAAGVSVPEEALVFPRLVASEYAEGGSIYDLPGERRAPAARKILEMEGDIYFTEAPLVRYDPDRHPGNYRVLARADGKVEVSVIDHGQGSEITRAERESVFRLFALAQVLARAGASRWAAREAAAILGLENVSPRRLRRALGRYFPDPGMRPVQAYYSLLAALDDAGVQAEEAYFSYVRGIIQLSQYEELAGDMPKPSPARRLEAEVSARAKEMAGRLTLTPFEKLKLGLRLGRLKFERAPGVRKTGRVLRSRPVRRTLVLALALAFLAPFWSPLQAAYRDHLRPAVVEFFTDREEKALRDFITLEPGSPEARARDRMWLVAEGNGKLDRKDMLAAIVKIAGEGWENAWRLARHMALSEGYLRDVRLHVPLDDFSILMNLLLAHPDAGMRRAAFHALLERASVKTWRDSYEDIPLALKLLSLHYEHERTGAFANRQTPLALDVMRIKLETLREETQEALPREG